MASVRDAFFNKIYDLVKNGEEIYIITADLGAPSLDDFRRDFPDYYISVGIAEQNLISVAAGMALAGKKVVAYGLNPFPATRAFDQIRSLMAELNIPMTVCALNAGICAAECGYTHMPVEDMAMLRTLSNVKVINPSDEIISSKLAADTCSLKYPRFIRFEKFITGKRYAESEIDFNTGYAIAKKVNDSNKKLSIITNGIYVPQLATLLAKEKYNSVQIIDIFSLPVNEVEFIKEIKDYKHIITIEENVLAGGIGSYVLEMLSDYDISKSVYRMGLNFNQGYYDVFTSRDYIRENQKIDKKNILQTIDRFLKKESDI